MKTFLDRYYKRHFFSEKIDAGELLQKSDIYV